MVAGISKTFNGYLNISKVSTCILKPDVILRKKIDKKIRFEILKSIVYKFTYFNKFISAINNLYFFRN